MVKMFQSVNLPAFMNDDSQLLVLMACIMMIGGKEKILSIIGYLKMKLHTFMAIFTKANVAVHNNCYKYILQSLKIRKLVTLTQLWQIICI